MLHYIVIFTSIILFSSLLTAQDLSGLDDIYVKVSVNDEVKEDLRTSRIKTDIELKLRLVGITVVDEAIDSKATYELQIYELKFFDDKVFVANINAHVIERVYYARRLENKDYNATTYHSSYLFYANTTDMNNDIRNKAKDMTDTFINKYLAHNPK